MERNRIISKLDMIIFSIGYLQEHGADDEGKFQENLFLEPLDISKNSYRQYRSRSIREGYLERISEDGDNHYRLTDEGSAKYKTVKKKIISMNLGPDLNNISRIVPLNSVLGYIPRLDDRMIFLIMIITGREMDVHKILDMLRSRHMEKRDVWILRELVPDNSKEERTDLDKDIRRSMMIGIEANQVEAYDPDNVDQQIVLAELSRRRGDIEYAKVIYNSLLSSDKGLEPNQWLVCRIGMVHCCVYSDDIDEALKDLEDIYKQLSDPVHKAFCKKIKADILSDIARIEDASVLYRSCLSLFYTRDRPNLRCSTLVNLGVLHFRKGNVKNAENLWKEAKQVAIQNGLDYAISIININLADSSALSGNIEEATKYLSEAEEILERIGDLEGISGVHFNRALVYVEAGDREKALESYRISEEFTLQYKLKASERRKVFKDRLSKKGWGSEF